MTEPLDLETLKVALQDHDAGWTMDVNNPLVRMSEQDRRIRLGFTPPPGEMTLKQAAAADAKAPTIAVGEAMGEDNLGAPLSFDLRNVDGKNYTTPVKNQGGCGSCVAFGAVAVMETTYQLTKNQPGSGIDLSEAHMFYCHGAAVGRDCSNGWFPEPAFAAAKAQGVATEDKYPYAGSQQACLVASDWATSKAMIGGATKTGTRAAMKEWLSTKGSLTGCFVVYQDFFAYRSGVYTHVTGNQAGGHCVEIIGYSDAEAAWICKNSWGTGWGDKGYFKIGYGQCELEKWAGPFGVTGVELSTWLNKVEIQGLWSNSAANNGYALLAGRGWTKVANSSNATQRQLMTELVGARAGGRKVNALVDHGLITELYVL